MTNPGNNYYQILGLHPSASNLEIRRQYRELSKQFHPDTTTLPKAIAKTKFQELNQAYATIPDLAIVLYQLGKFLRYFCYYRLLSVVYS